MSNIKKLSKYTAILAASLTLTACATTRAPVIVQQPVPIQSASTSSAIANFDCDKLYSNHAAAMANFQVANAPEKKKSLLGGIGSTVFNHAGTVASLGGVNFIQAQKIGQAAKLTRMATGQENPNDPTKMMEVMGTASSALEVQRTSMRLALENGCDIEKFNQIPK